MAGNDPRQRPPAKPSPRSSAAPPRERGSAHESGRRRAGAGSKRAELDTICGVAAVEAALAARPAALRRLLLRSDLSPRFALVMRGMAEARLPYALVSDDELERAAASDRHQGVVAHFVAAPPLGDDEARQRLRSSARPLGLYLDGVGNPHNVGAIARSAAHFGVDILLQRAGPGSARPSAAARRVAEGGLEAVPLAMIADPQRFLMELRASGCMLLATSASDGVPPWRVDLRRPLIWLLGAEERGLDPVLVAAADHRVAVPGSGAVESLNVSATAAILLAETARQREGAGGPTTTRPAKR